MSANKKDMSQVTKSAFREWMLRQAAIENMAKDPKYLEHVLIYLTANDHIKKYRKCIMFGTDDASTKCPQVGSADTFRGRMCADCAKLYKKKINTKRAAVAKSQRKKKSTATSGKKPSRK